MIQNFLPHLKYAKSFDEMKKDTTCIVGTRYGDKIRIMDCPLDSTEIISDFIGLKIPKGMNKFKKLKRLEIKHTFISKHGKVKTTPLKIQNLDGMKNLEQLILTDNGIEKIEGLDGLKNLKKLDLSNNQIKEIEGLYALVNLEILKLNRNDEINEVKGLKNNKKLKELYLNNSSISKLNNINHLKELEFISLMRVKKLKEIGNLDNLKKLRIFFMSHNPNFNRIDEISRLEGLEDIMVEKSSIDNIDSLEKLRDMKIMELNNNKIEKINWKKNKFTELEILDLRDNPLLEIKVGKKIFVKSLDLLGTSIKFIDLNEEKVGLLITRNNHEAHREIVENELDGIKFLKIRRK